MPTPTCPVSLGLLGLRSVVLRLRVTQTDTVLKGLERVCTQTPTRRHPCLTYDSSPTADDVSGQGTGPKTPPTTGGPCRVPLRGGTDWDPSVRGIRLAENFVPRRTGFTLVTESTVHSYLRRSGDPRTHAHTAVVRTGHTLRGPRRWSSDRGPGLGPGVGRDVQVRVHLLSLLFFPWKCLLDVFDHLLTCSFCHPRRVDFGCELVDFVWVFDVLYLRVRPTRRGPLRARHSRPAHPAHEDPTPSERRS